MPTHWWLSPGLGAVVCDAEQVIALAGPAKKELLHTLR